MVYRTILLALCFALSSSSASAMELLGVGTAESGESAATPVAGAAPAPAAASADTPAAPSAGGCLTPELQKKLHAEGKRVALIIRAGRLAIHKSMQDLVQNFANQLKDDPKVQGFLRDNLQKEYLTDDAATRAALEGAGYEVVHLASSDYETSGRKAQFKPDVIQALGRAHVVVFYGHGNRSGLLLTSDREYAVAGPKQMLAMLTQPPGGSESLDLGEFKAALGNRKLDALVLHSCNGGQGAYLKEHGGTTDETFADLVDPAGFFAGWVTYSVYLDPGTPAILSAFFCHQAGRLGGATPPTARSARYYLKTAGHGRKLSLLAGLDDGTGLGAVLADVDRDPDVHAMSCPQITACEGIAMVIDFLYDVRRGKQTFAADVHALLQRSAVYLAGNKNPALGAGVHAFNGLRSGGARLGRLLGNDREPAGPSRMDLSIDNKLLAAVQGTVVKAVNEQAGDVLHFDTCQIRLDKDRNSEVLFDLTLDVKNGKQVSELVAALRKTYERPAQAGIAATGGTVGPQLATRVQQTLDGLLTRLPDTLLRVRTSLAIEKVVPASGENQIKPWVFGYNLAVGQVAAEKSASSRSPYEIHISLDTVNALLSETLTGMFGKQVELKATYDPGMLAPNITLYAYLKLFMVMKLRRLAANRLVLPLAWEVNVYWGPLIGDGYAYFTSTIDLTVKPKGGLVVGLTPTVSFSLGDGWSVFEGLVRAVSTVTQAWVNSTVAARTAAGIDFASFIPAAVAQDVAGKVQISAITIDDDCVSVFLDHVRSNP